MYVSSSVPVMIKCFRVYVYVFKSSSVPILEWNVLFICDKWNLSEMFYLYVISESWVKCVMYMYLIAFLPVCRQKEVRRQRSQNASCMWVEVKRHELKSRQNASCMFVRPCHAFCMFLSRVLYVEVRSFVCKCHECLVNKLYVSRVLVVSLFSLALYKTL